MTMRVPSVSVSELSISYQTGRRVISNLGFVLEAGSVIAILGRNGVGKSSLLGAIAGTVPYSGSVTVGASGIGRRRFAYLHQNYRESNFPWTTAVRNVEYPLRAEGVPLQKRRYRALRALRRIAPEVDPGRVVHKLSGGQQQLVALARAMASDEGLWLADEPLSAVDPIRSLEVIDVLRTRWLQAPRTVIWVCHSIDEAILVGDTIGVLSADEMEPLRLWKSPLGAGRSLEDLQEPHVSDLQAQLRKHLTSRPAFQLAQAEQELKS